ncbi:MAG TPA: DUF4411 family protein [Saprospiraceae bacterium]|jgi:hypothetical protein|nr:DUF4411 family protein [Saprospiraceae bacterium]HMT71660.1 DUF4411 family protein [Saprospiraceae bacterium]
MKVVIDTNSLLSLVRYYLPFDKKGVLFQFIKSKIENGDIVIIDKVLEEITYNSKGLVLEKLPYLTDKTFLKTARIPYKTDSLLVPNTKLFFHQLNNLFVNNIVKKSQGLTDVEFENRKGAFIESADMKQVILSLNLKAKGEQVILVTEETESSNDNKLFKKIPAICKVLEIETLTLPELIAKYEGIDIDFQ